MALYVYIRVGMYNIVDYCSCICGRRRSRYDVINPNMKHKQYIP